MKYLNQALVFLVLTFGMINVHTADAQKGAQPWYRIVPVTGEPVINLTLNFVSEENIDISLRDPKGEIIWRHDERMKEYAKSIVLSALPDGQYYLGIQRDGEYAEEAFYLEGHHVMLVNRLSTHVMAPTLAIKGREVIVDYGTVDSDKLVTIVLLTEQGDEIFSQEVKTSEKGIVRYDVSSFEPGIYRVRFSIGSRNFTRTFQLR